jgi:acetylornithine deacetylase
MNREWIGNAGIQGLIKELVAENSVSSVSNVPASQKVADWLESIGFEIEWLEYVDSSGIKKANIVAVRRALQETQAKGGAVYLAHTDVVPVDDWDTGFSGPFEAVEKHARLYGRGTCDMKGSLCCAILAASLIDRRTQTRPLFMVVTADEEVGMHGAQYVDQQSKLWREMIQRDVVGIIGEPTEMQVVHGHKGTYGVILRANGQSAHTSTGRGINANYALIPALAPLLALRDETERLDEYRNSDYDPPTLTWNMVIKNEPLALNVTTATAEVQIFYRTMPGVDLGCIEKRLRQIQQEYGLEWIDRGEKPSWYVDSQAPWIRQMLDIAGQDQSQTVSYATDGSVLQGLEKLLICGPGSIEQAHRKDEWVSIEQLHQAVKVYEQAFRKWAC